MIYRLVLVLLLAILIPEQALAQVDSAPQAARIEIEQSINMLSHSSNYYHGHVSQAISYLTQSRNYIDNAIIYDQQRAGWTYPTIVYPFISFYRGANRPKAETDQALTKAAKILPDAIATLRAEPRTYGGNIPAALSSLIKARQQINYAIQYAHLKVSSE